MKKNWMLLAIVLLAFAGVFMLGCSDSGGSDAGGDPFNYYFQDGELNIYIDKVAPSLVIEQGKDYDVIISLNSFSSELVGGHFGLQVFSDEKDFDDENIKIMPWQNGSPDTIANSTKQVKWRILNFADPGTDRLYLNLVVQKPWGTAIPGKVGFNGAIAVAEFDTSSLSFVKAFDIDDTSTLWDYMDGPSLKGKLNPTISAEIMGFANGYLIVHYTGLIGTDGFTAGNGIASVGANEFDDSGFPINTPNPFPGGLGTGDTYNGDVKVFIEDIKLDDGGNLETNSYNGATITLIEVWKVDD